MAFIRTCLVTVVMFFCIVHTKAQTIYYPLQSSKLLKATADDLAMLLHKAIPAVNFNTASYTSIPASGIIFIYDSTITGQQACYTLSDGASFIKLRAPQDNGLVFGAYQYLQQCGFKFYQPGSIWEIIPSLISPYKKIDTTYSSTYKYKSWAISGGCNKWIMDKNDSFGWDTYFGENGHNWALYQRRNGMTGAYLFTGHRGDLMTGNYLSTLQSNPCYVACYNGSRQAGYQSVPDIFNNGSMELWNNAIQQQYTNFKNTIYNNPVLYNDYYRNFDYRYNHIGIEVPDGAQWGNSKDNGLCSTIDYPKESDQHFILANFTAQKLNTQYPNKQLQLYAYSRHADIPSANISIDKKINIEVVPTAFQSITSAKGLLNRWYNKSSAVSEYHYLNISQWGGETPMLYLKDLQQTLQRVKEKNSQGVLWEASPAKFASLPFLLAANSNLKDNIEVDSSLRYFCNDLFGAANNTLYKLLQLWSDDKSVTIYDFMADNKYKIPHYLQLLNEAVLQSQHEPTIVIDRIRELKAYLHYMVLYYDWLYDRHSHQAKVTKAAALCMYLAKVNKLQIVNSFFLIKLIVNNYAVADDFYKQYNTVNGTAYQNGSLPLITPAQIDIDFQQDLATKGQLIEQYNFSTAGFIKDQFEKAKLTPLKKINVKIGYTNGLDNSNRREFYIDAPAAGSFVINYTPHFNIPGKGYINFTVESADKALDILKDYSIDQTAKPGSINISLPSAGTYKFSLVSKFQSAVDLEIITNGNYFYKNGPFLGCKTENYRSDLSSLPGYFYVPSGISKIYFNINNSGPGGSGYATAEDISKAFVIKDNRGSTLLPRLVTPNDSALFYLEVPSGGSGTFWQAQKMEQYNLCFANISNLQWYAQQSGNCANADFSMAVINKNGHCIIQLTAAAKTGEMKWEVKDAGTSTTTFNQFVLQLPATTTDKAIVTLIKGGNCSVTKKINEDEKLVNSLKECTAIKTTYKMAVTPSFSPNPSNGIFTCLQNGESTIADEIIITNAQGIIVGNFSAIRQFNISSAPAGVYWYKMKQNGQLFSGRLLKL